MSNVHHGGRVSRAGGDLLDAAVRHRAARWHSKVLSIRRKLLGSELNVVSCDLRASCIIQFALAVITSVSSEPVTAPTVVYVHVASANDLHWLTTFAYPCRERAFRVMYAELLISDKSVQHIA